MATHSSIFAWRIPWAEVPRGLQSMGSQRDRTEQLNDNNNMPYRRASLVARWEVIHLECRTLGFNPRVRKIPWRRE